MQARSLPYGQFGVTTQVTKDTVGVAGAVTTASIPVVSAALLAAAGVSATVPVAGWIGAGVLAAAAGVAAIVAARGKGKAREDQAVAMLTAAGVPNADLAPGEIASALQNGPVWVAKEIARLRTAASFPQGVFHHPFDKDSTIAAKLQLMLAIQQYQSTGSFFQAPVYRSPASISPALSKQTPMASSTSWLLVAVVVVAVGGAIVVIKRRRG